MNYCVIDENGIVVNIIVWDGVSGYNPGAGLSLVQSDTAGIGDTYNPEKGEITKPVILVEEQSETVMEGE